MEQSPDQARRATPRGSPLILPPASALEALFRRLFSPAELLRFLRLEPDGIALRARTLALRSAGVPVYRAAVRALRGLGRIDRPLFEALLYLRSAQEEGIRSVASSWLGAEAMGLTSNRARRTLDAQLVHALCHLTWNEQVLLAVAHGVPQNLLPDLSTPLAEHALAVVDLSMALQLASRDRLEAALRARVPAAFVT